MPVSRGYGSSGYTPSYSPSYFSLYSPNSYSYRSGSNNISSSASMNRSGTPNRISSLGSSNSFGEADSRRIRSYSSDPTTSVSGKKHELSRLPPLPSRFKDLVLVCKDKDTGAARLHLKLSGAGTTGGSGSRAGTPSRGSSSTTTDRSSVLAESDRRRDIRNHAISPIGAPAAYKYFSRAEYYNTTAIFNRNMESSIAEKKAVSGLKTIKTDDLDVDQPKETQREHAVPGQIKRDTTANIAGGKQVIRLVTTKQRVNPYNRIGAPIPSNPDEMTLGQKLAMKYQMSESPVPKITQPSAVQPANTTITTTKKESSVDSEGSDWTWETCSESEEDETGSTATTATTNTTTAQRASSVVATSASNNINTTSSLATTLPSSSSTLPSRFKIDARTQKWLDYKVEKPSATTATTTTTNREEPVKSNAEKRNSCVPRIYTESVKSSSSTDSSSGTDAAKYIKAYTGAGSKTRLQLPDETSTSSTDEEISAFWRKGQPPRGDVVVKLVNQEPKMNAEFKSEPSMPKMNAAERVANKILVGPIHKVQKIEAPKLPPLKFAYQHVEHHNLEDQPNCLNQRRASTLMETINETIVRQEPRSKVLVRQAMVKQQPFEFNTYNTECITDFNTELAIPLDTIFKPHSVYVEVRSTPNIQLNSCLDVKIRSEIKPEMAPRDWIPESRVDHEMLNPFITPKLKNISVKPPDLVKNEVKVAEIVTPTRITQPEKVEHVTVEAKIEPIIVEEIKVKPTFLHISLDPSQPLCAQNINYKSKETAYEEDIIETKIVTVSPKVTQPPATPVTQPPAPSVTSNSKIGEQNTKINKNEPSTSTNRQQVDQITTTTKTTVPAKISTVADLNAKVTQPPVQFNKPQITQPPAQLEKPQQMEQASQQAIQPKRKYDQQEPAKQSVEVVENKSTKPKTKEPSAGGDVKKKPKKVKKDTKSSMPDIVKSTQKQSDNLTSEELMNESIQTNTLIPKKVLTDIIDQNRDLPEAVIAEIPMVKAAIEYNFSCEETKKEESILTESQLARIPTPFRKFYEMKSKGVIERTMDEPTEKPAYWNNTPKESDSNSFLELSKLKSDVKKHKEQQKAEANRLAEEEAKSKESEELWYKDESEEFQENLKEYQHRMSDHNRPINERRTPAENMAIIKMYGGIMFPNINDLTETPIEMLKSHPGSGSKSSTNAKDQLQVKRESLCNFNEPPVKARPMFRKYEAKDFKFLKVLGKGSFGKVLLAELTDGSQSYYAVKCLKKDLILEDDDIECTLIERKVLALGCKHPFICHLFCTFQTTSHMFYAMEYLNGGDLMFHIQQCGKFDLDRARFYAAEILLAMKFLHRKGIVYRDLKLDNVLLDFEGHVRLADFGMCKLQIYLDRVTDTFCGTPDYMAPEIIKGLKYNYLVDWWSFGVLLYEMLLGQSPFNGCDEDELFWSICNETAFFPKFLTKESKHLIMLLLEKEPRSRLGVRGCKHGEVADQPFFKSIDFDKLERKQLIPPFKPNLLNAKDVSYFDSAFTEEAPLLTPVPQEFLDPMNQEQFKGFSYTDRDYALPAL